MSCDQIPNGASDPKLKERLWEDDCYLDKLIKRCNFHKQTQQTRKLAGVNSDAQVSNGAQEPSRTRGRACGNPLGSTRGQARGRSQPRQQSVSGQQGQGQGQGHDSHGRSRGYYSQTSCGNCGRVHGPRQRLHVAKIAMVVMNYILLLNGVGQASKWTMMMLNKNYSSVLRNGWLKQRWEVPPKVQAFGDYQEELTKIGGIILKGEMITKKYAKNSYQKQVGREERCGMTR